MNSIHSTASYASEEDDVSATSVSKSRWLTFKRPCPSCNHSYALERVPRPFFLKYVLFFIPTRMYYCYNCQRKFTRIN